MKVVNIQVSIKHIDNQHIEVDENIVQNLIVKHLNITNNIVGVIVIKNIVLEQIIFNQATYLIKVLSNLFLVLENFLEIEVSIINNVKEVRINNLIGIKWGQKIIGIYQTI